jgi:protein phosphatase PTC7
VQFSVTTGDERAAGCETNAIVTLLTSKGNLTTKLAPSGGRFERAQQEWFKIIHNDQLGPIEEIQVSTDALGKHDGWYLQSIDVVVEDLDQPVPRPELTQFRFNEWIGGRHPGGLVPAVTEVVVRHPYDLSAEHGTELYPHQLLHQPLTLRHCYSAYPHPTKVAAGTKARCRRFFGCAGEDAYGINITQWHALLAVSDGVQAWAEQDIDSGLFAQALVTHLMQSHKEHAQRACEEFESASSLDDRSLLDGWLLKEPIGMIAQAHRAAIAQGVQGSATLSLGLFNGLSGVLTSANIGDSGLMVVRGGGGRPSAMQLRKHTNPSLLYRTHVQEHRFGKPYQLGHHAGSDQASDAELATIQLNVNDVIVLGSDGLFDNLSAYDICAIVADCERPWQAANKLSQAAFEVSVNKAADSPWAREATEELDMFYSGGKKDDITVVTAEVVPLVK